MLRATAIVSLPTYPFERQSGTGIEPQKTKGGQTLRLRKLCIRYTSRLQQIYIIILPDRVRECLLF